MVLAVRTSRSAGAAPGPRPARMGAARSIELARRGWRLDGGEPLLVRGLDRRDLAAVAALHGRCGAQTLLQRYRNGGRPPSLAGLDHLVRLQLVLGAWTQGRQLVALGVADVPEAASFQGEFSLLVQDDRQGRGIGTALAKHLCAALWLAGAGQGVTRSAAPSLPLHRVASSIGPTRHVQGPQRCSELRVRLEVGVVGGLGGGGELLG